MPRTRRRVQTSPLIHTTAQSSTQTNTEEDDTIIDLNINDQNVDQNSSDTDSNNSSNKSKPKIQIFKGIGDKVTIENWLKRFEMLSQFYKYSEKTKIVMLGNYLEDDALNWYIENYCDDNYIEIKQKLINRFGLETVEPIVEFVNLRYDFKTGIKEYFETKRRYGVAAKLTESQMIPLMINNLPLKMIDCFTAVKAKTFSEFYSIAKTAENNYKRNSFKNQSFNEKPKVKNENSSVKPKRKPPNPCRICEGLGFKGRYHWSNDCTNKSKTNPTTQTNSKTINSIENNSNELSENDIRNIDLN